MKVKAHGSSTAPTKNDVDEEEVAITLDEMLAVCSKLAYALIS